MTVTAIFLAFSAAFATLLWIDRPSAGRSFGWRSIRTALVILLPWAAFVGATIAKEGDRLTVRIDQLRVPAAVVTEAAPKNWEPFLMVGDRADSADLVVTPFSDQGLSRLLMPAAPRSFVAVEAMILQSGLRENRLRLESFAPDADIPGMQVTFDKKVQAFGKPSFEELKPDTRHRIEIARIDGTEKPKLRRSFWLALTGGERPAVELTLDASNPLVADAGTCEHPQLRLAPMIDRDSADAVFRDPENLVLKGLGAAALHPVVETSGLGPIAEAATLCARSRTGFYWPRAFNADGSRLRGASQKVFLPWYFCIFATLCALALHMLAAPGWRTAGPERVIVPLLQWLMTLRLLIAVAGYYNDLNLPPGAILWDGLAAYLCLPVLAVIGLREGSGRALAPLMAGLALLMLCGAAGAAFALKTIDLFSMPSLLCLFTMVAAVARIYLPGEQSPLAYAVGQAGRLAAYDPMRPLRGLGEKLAGTPVAFRWGVALLGLLVAMRLVLLLIGAMDGSGGAKFTERVFGLPLSLIYVPVSLLGFALLLTGVREWSAWRAARCVVGAFVLVHLIVPWLTSDTGALFVSGWPTAAMITAIGLRRHGRSGPAALGWIAPTLAPVLLVMGYGAILWMSWPIPSPVTAETRMAASAEMQTDAEGGAPDATAIGPHIARAIEWSRNDVRLLAFFSPDAVEQIGTKYAFESLDLSTSLGPLTADIWGRGWLAPSGVHASLLDNQYFENLSAVHLIWPLGRIGALGLLLVIGTAMAALRPARAEGPGEPGMDVLDLTAALARLTFLWAAAYMLLANLNLVPFTGRNIYLLSVSSWGDLMEGLVLVAIMCLPFVRAEAR